jgi:serine/threonine-protein kinase
MNVERLGPYVVDKRIGRGGMGTVFAAHAEVTGEPVAVKVLSHLQGLDDDIHDRFAAEIESLRLLNHPNIVRIFGFGEEDGFRFYAMELVDGSSLQDALDAGRRFSWTETVQFGVAMCRALKHAHDRGIVHRDIKPGNLLLTSDGVMKLSDFGIAKSFGNAGMTADGGVIGTAEYMSPEQAEGKPATQRSDLYSLGGVLYAMLANRPPFRAKSLIEMLQLQKFAEPEPLLRFEPSLPRPLNDLVMQLLAKDPAKRMPNAMMTARALEAVLAATAPGVPDDGARAEDDPRDCVLPAYTGGDLPADAAPDAHTAVAPDAAPEKPAYAISGRGSIDATHEIRVAPVAPKPVPAARVDSPVGEARRPDSARASGGIVTRTYTPVDREDHGRLERREEEQPAWISPQTWGLVAAMVTLGLFTWYWLQPPSAEKLYDRVTAAASQGKVERLVDVEDDIKDFLEYYPSDRRGRELQSYLDEIDLYRLERKFELRGRILAKNEKLLPVERLYLEAIAYSQLSPALGRKKLQALVDLFREVPEQSKQARECLVLAQRQLDRLRRMADGQQDDDRKLIETQLARAEALDAEDAEEAERIRRAVVELYDDQPWAEPLLAAAREALEHMPARVAKQNGL